MKRKKLKSLSEDVVVLPGKNFIDEQKELILIIDMEVIWKYQQR